LQDGPNMTGLNDRSEVACVLFGGCAAVVCEKCHYTSLNLFQPGVLTPPLPCIGFPAQVWHHNPTIPQSHNPTKQKNLRTASFCKMQAI